MKLVRITLLLLLISVFQTAWSGTTTVVLQNFIEGGYQGCSDAWIDKDWDIPTGDDKLIKLWYELCES